MASYWEDLFQGLGSGIFGQAASSFDPYAEDRQMRQGAINKAMLDYDKMLSTPGGMIPQGYRDMLYKQSDENIRSQRPQAGGSAWLNDASARGRNEINLGLVKQELDQANAQRNYLSQLMGISQPQSYLPRQAGAIEKGLSGPLQRGSDEFSDWIFGKPQEGGTAQGRLRGPTKSPTQVGGFDMGNMYDDRRNT